MMMIGRRGQERELPAEPVDLSLPSEQIMTETEKHCRETAGFMPLDAWKAEVARRLERRD
jgi:hypothetical protein